MEENSILNRDTYIWGAGKFGVLTALDCKQKGIKIVGFIDNNAENIKTRLNLPVLEPNSLLLSHVYVIIAIQEELAIMQVKEYLVKTGLKDGIDFEVSKKVVNANKIRRVKNFLISSLYILLGLASKEYIRFKKTRIESKSILLIEPNTYHGEIIPGYVKYLNDLGYNVDLILQPRLKKDAPFVRCSKIPNTFYMLPNVCRKALKLNKIIDYDFIFLTTSNLGDKRLHYNNSFLKYLGFMPKTKYGFLMVEHRIKPNIEQYGHYKYSNRMFTLAGFCNTKMLNPHYFGDNIKISKKSNSKIIFVAVVNCNNNDVLLFNSIHKLISTGYDNFKVIIIGRTVVNKVPQDFKSLVEITGIINFDEYWKIIELADFFITMLNPEIESQRMYMGNVVTASGQTIMGFRKPALIISEFAKYYRLDDANAILYEKNEKLPDAMKKAINMSQREYENLQNNIAALANNIERESLNNLRNTINEITSASTMG